MRDGVKARPGIEAASAGSASLLLLSVHVAFPFGRRSKNLHVARSELGFHTGCPFYFMSSGLAKRKRLRWTDFKRIESNVSQCAASGQLHSVFMRNWSIANQSGSLLIQREPNCVKLIKSDGCVCFHSWLRCSAEPLSLYFIRILPKSIKGPVFYTPTLSLIKLALIILADVWSSARNTRTIPGCLSRTLGPLFPSSERVALKVTIFKHALVMSVNN